MKSKTNTFLLGRTMAAKTYEIYHFCDSKVGPVSIHHHNYYEFYLFLSGQVNYRVESDIYTLQSGQFLLIPPKTMHQPLIQPGKTYERFVLWVDSDYLESITAGTDLLSCFRDRHYILNSLPQYDLITVILNRLMEENQSGKAFKEELTHGLFLLLLSLLNRMSHPDAVPVAEQQNPITSMIIEYISENFRENISLDSVAKHFNVSKYHLSHVFSQDIGVSLHHFLKVRRLLYADELLQNGATPTEACVDCGFNDYNNFSRAYKEQFGISPRLRQKNADHSGSGDVL